MEAIGYRHIEIIRYGLIFPGDRQRQGPFRPIYRRAQGSSGQQSPKHPQHQMMVHKILFHAKTSFLHYRQNLQAQKRSLKRLLFADSIRNSMGVYLYRLMHWKNIVLLHKIL